MEKTVVRKVSKSPQQSEALGGNYLSEVKDQYEDYPYPFRNPEDDRRRLLLVMEDMLPRVNHYCFGGAQDFKNFQVLVAGGGTGDSSIFLAKQLQELNGHVVHLDLSTASIAIARKRAEIQKLTNITFMQRSLMDLPSLGIGPFDYINCCGVLHHLADPDAGLAALKSVLKPAGAMALMVYGKHSRSPVYQMQEMLRIVNAGIASNQQKVARGHAMLAALPESNYFKRTPLFANEIPAMGDIGLYDLLLHPQDRAYSIPELYDFVERAGLHIAAFSNPRGRPAYDALAYVKDSALNKDFASRPLRELQAIGELMSCEANRHSVYVTASRGTPAHPENLQAIPFFVFPDQGRQFTQTIPPQLRERFGRWLTIKIDDLLSIMFEATEHVVNFLEAIDGQRSIGQILAIAKAKAPHAQEAQIKREFNQLYQALNKYDTLLLRLPEAGEPISLA